MRLEMERKVNAMLTPPIDESDQTPLPNDEPRDEGGEGHLDPLEREQCPDEDIRRWEWEGGSVR